MTKNFVTFKRWDGVKDEKNQYYAGSLKNRFIGAEAGDHEKLIYRMKLPKNEEGRLRQFLDLRGHGKKRRGCYPNVHYELGNNFNCDFNSLMPISSLLI